LKTEVPEYYEVEKILKTGKSEKQKNISLSFSGVTSLMSGYIYDLKK